MYNKLRNHIDMLFADAPPTKKTVEVKEEILQNLYDKYNDLVGQGKSEEAAYNIVVAGIGDISGLIGELKRGESNDQQDQLLYQQHNRKKALFTSIAIALYIVCVLPVIIFQSEFGIVLMFILVAAATAMLVFVNMTKSKAPAMDPTMVEEFQEWRASSSQKKQLLKSIHSVVWALALVLYFLISFSTGAWHITWLVFVIAGAVNSIVRAVFDLRG